MPLVAAAVVPHAPVLVAGYEGPESADLEEIRSACREVRDVLQAAERVVVVSPHASCSCVYSDVRGDLASFGVEIGPARRRRDERGAATLASDWRMPLVTDDVDHGITVPLLLGCLPDAPVVAAGVVETTGPDAHGAIEQAWDDAAALARAVSLRAADDRIAVVVSAHLGAALDASAPLSLDDRAVDLEQEVLAALEYDVASFTPLGPALAASGSCGAAPLAVLATLFPGRRLTRLAYKAPFGVGYLVGVIA